MLSLNTRLLLAASIILMLFFGITGFTLDKMYRENAENAQRNRLQGYVYELITAIEFTNVGKLGQPHPLHEVKFSIPYSGLYGQITQNQGKVIWTSESVHAQAIPFKYGLGRGFQQFELVKNKLGKNFYTYSFGISWDETIPKEQAYTFSVAETTETFDADVSNFRKNLWGSLSGVAFLMLLVQGLILRWGLSPLRQVTDDLKTIEAGNKLSLDGKYPLEIRRLTDDLNALLHSNNENLKRYRQALGDLAHSLKTPLALLQSTVESRPKCDPLQQGIQNQINRMKQIIEYQLQRAATAGRSAFATPVEVKPIVKKITSSLNKVYADKQVALRATVSPNTLFYGDTDDLMEIIGNLLDNACKWCQRQVSITIENSHTSSTRPGLTIAVDDDGPGIPEDRIQQVLQRGIRADENVGGHGIGMAIINDLTNSYGGKVSIKRNKQGGTRITISLPGS